MGKIISIVKIATVKDNITDYIGKFSNNFQKGPGITSKYFTIVKDEKGRSHMLMISQSEHMCQRDNVSYNVIVSVMGFEEGLIRAVLKDFESKVPFEFRDAPPMLKRGFIGAL